jgi:hypothetical protein
MPAKKRPGKKVAKKTTKKTIKKVAQVRAPTRKKKRVTKKTRPAIITPDDSPDMAAAFERGMAETYPWPLRPHQQLAMNEFNAGRKRQGLFWARRSGKDIFCLSLARNQARKRIGSYVHCFPKYSQARRALWQGIDPGKGQNFIDAAFGDMETGRNNTDMMVEFYNGSNWQLAGSDNFNRIVGSNIVGVCFSEWALCDPRAWDYLRPMILENDGWAVFISTFRGRNHAWQMSENLKNNPDWFIDIRGVDKIVDINGERIITDKMIDSERESGMSQALIDQEYYCRPDAASDGAIYGKQVEHLRNDPARNLGDWNPSKPVYCVWNFDLPVFAAFLMIQPGDRPVILDAGILEFTTLGEAIAHANTRRWPIQKHFVLGHQREIAAAMQDLNVRPDVLPLRNELIATTRAASFIERMRLDGERCNVLLDALSGYVRRERFDPQAAALQFGADPVMSWHWRLAYPLESFATWDYAQGDTWGPTPNYAAQDRAIKTVL